jgi:hypothetical protein
MGLKQSPPIRKASLATAADVENFPLPPNKYPPKNPGSGRVCRRSRDDRNQGRHARRPMNAFKNGKLEKRLVDGQEQINPIVEPERYRRDAYLTILSGTPVQEPAAEHPDAQWLAVVHDLMGLGPAGFHEQTLERFAGRASYIAVVSFAADPSLYRAFASMAAVLGRLLFVETKLPLYAAWRRFLLQYSPHGPVLLCPPEGMPL